MKRLTKTACEYAATELAKIAFDKNIEDATEELKKVGDELINTLIPKPLMALSKEYSDLFIDKKKYYSSSLRTNFYYVCKEV